MENMWMIWIIFTFIYHFVCSANDVSTCRNESDCTPNHVCQDNICKKCINCQLLFREGGDCENEFNDCGQCLPGYKEVSTTNYSNVIKPCRPEKPKPGMCANDEDCPTDSYCYEAYCTSCFDCSLFNKQPPSKGCAKDFNECGFCLEGYYELPVTTNSELKSCGRKLMEWKVPKIVWKIIILIPLCVLSAIAVIFVKLIIRKGKRMEKLIKYFGRYFVLVKDDGKVVNVEEPVSPSAPPLFVLDMPEKVRCEEKCESRVPFAREVKQQANTARVFKQPTALYYFAEESADDLSDHSNDSNEEEAGPPQRRNEQEEECSPSIFIHRYKEIGDPLSSQGVSDGSREISVDAIDSASISQSPSENAPKPAPPNDDSNSSIP